MSVCARARARVCVCVCGCVGERGTERDLERIMELVFLGCVCVCVCVKVHVDRFEPHTYTVTEPEFGASLKKLLMLLLSLRTTTSLPSSEKRKEKSCWLDLCLLGHLHRVTLAIYSTHTSFSPIPVKLPLPASPRPDERPTLTFSVCSDPSA